VKKGVILEIEGRFMTMLTPEGEFLRALNEDGNHEIGEEIYFYPIETPERGGKGLLTRIRARKKLFSAAVLACLLALFLVIPYADSDEVYAYMTIDVNPSIELGVDKELSVVELHSFNQEGKDLLSLLGDWKGDSADDVTRKILTLAEQQGYLKKDEEMIIASVLKEDGAEGSSESKKLNSQIESIKETAEEENLEVKILEATEDEREKAKEEGLSAGQFKEEELKRKQQADEKKREKEEASREKAEIIKRKKDQKNSASGDKAGNIGRESNVPSSQPSKNSGSRQAGNQNQKEADKKNNDQKGKPDNRQKNNQKQDKVEERKQEQKKHEKPEKSPSGNKGKGNSNKERNGNGQKGNNNGNNGNNGKSG
jgi:hypothetical protein